MNRNNIWHEWCEAMDRARRDNGVPGLAIAMVENGTDIKTRCFGTRDIRSGSPVTEQTLFSIGSTQKSVTAMFVASLIDDGLFSWETPVQQFCPHIHFDDAHAGLNISMRHLLGMCSGLPAGADQIFDQEAASAEDIFSFIAHAPLQCLPGERFDYSNLSFAAAGYAGALADGARWGQLEADFARKVRQRILQPIGMQDATLSEGEARASCHCSMAHMFNDADELVVIDDEVIRSFWLPPSGGMRASIRDMAKYLSTQIRDGIAPDGMEIVSARNLHETWTAQIAQASGRYYGMGWEFDEAEADALFFHEGAYEGFLALVAMIPERQTGIVVLCNMDVDDIFLQSALTQWCEFVDADEQ